MLKDMFPTFDLDVIASILSMHNGNMEAAMDELLQLSGGGGEGGEGGEGGVGGGRGGEGGPSAGPEVPKAAWMWAVKAEGQATTL